MIGISNNPTVNTVFFHWWIANRIENCIHYVFLSGWDRKGVRYIGKGEYRNGRLTVRYVPPVCSEIRHEVQPE